MPAISPEKKPIRIIVPSASKIIEDARSISSRLDQLNQRFDETVAHMDKIISMINRKIGKQTRR